MIEQKIVKKTCEAISRIYKQKVSTENISIQKTRQEFEGDFTIVVFPLTHFSKKSAALTANDIGKYLKSEINEIKDYNVIKGFLNLSIDDNYFWDFFIRNYENDKFGFIDSVDGKPIVIEYSSPNTNKPLHLGHIRNNLLGYSVAEILKANGKKVIKVNLVNNRGIHICKSMLAWKKVGRGETPLSTGIKGDHLIGKYYVLFETKYKEQVNILKSKGLSREEALSQAPLILEAHEMLRKWESKDKETIDLWNLMNSWAYKGFDETYKRLGVDFDKVYYESDTYLLGKDIVEKGLGKGILQQKDDGSVWADLTKDGLDEKLLIRKDGTSVYITQDLGTAQLRYDEYNPEKMIYVVGNEQNYHFEALKLILKNIGKDWASIINHLSYGMVELPEGKMKSREGKVVDADDLMDEMFETAKETTEKLGKVDEFSKQEAENLYRIVGLGALKYFILKVDPKKNMLFNPKESIDFNGNTGPFIQYTYARIQSVLRKSEREKTEKKFYLSNKFSLLPKEKKLLKLLYDFPFVVKQAGDKYNPALIANYVYEISKEYNQFYQEIPILKVSDKNIRFFRIGLSQFVANVIKSSMKLLGIEVPNRM